VANQRSNRTRPLVWEDEAPAESRFRRVEEGVSSRGGALPGMPLDMADLDGYGPPYTGGNRFGGGRYGWPGNNLPSGPWWRPASKMGRVFLGLGMLIVLGGLATGAFFLKTYLERDARFRIDGSGNIQATGLTEVSRAQILPVFGEDIGRNIFFVNLSDRRRQLEEIPWVERATVMRLLPDQIHVQVVERQPVAFVRQDQQIGLVDANGVLLSMPAATMAQHHYSFPVLTGIDPRDPLASRKARMAVYERLLAELDANNQHFSEQISEIDLTDPEDARVLMPEQGDDILAHFGNDRFLERYQRYKAHIAEWRQQYPKLAAVDLRYDRQVVLEMTRGANAAQSTVGDQAASSAENGKPPAAKPVEDSQSRPAPAKPVVKAKKLKAGAKPAGKATSRPKTAAAKNKAAKDKKRAEAQRDALNVSKRRPAPTTRPAAAEGQ
jgi:cell division protein FtsQ